MAVGCDGLVSDLRVVRLMAAQCGGQLPTSVGAGLCHRYTPEPNTGWRSSKPTFGYREGLF